MDKRLEGYKYKPTVQLFERDQVGFKPKVVGQKYCMGCMRAYVATNQQCPFCGYNASPIAEDGNYISPGTVINERYLIGKSLYRDTGTVTYVGKDCVTDRKVAVTEYLPSDISFRDTSSGALRPYPTKAEIYETGISGFIEDAIAASSVNHDRVARVYDIFEANDTAYVVTEYVEGVSLDEYLEGNMYLSYADAIGMVKQLFEIAGLINDIGMVSLNFTPRSIYLSNTDGIKIVNRNFGKMALAKCYGINESECEDGYAPEELYGDCDQVDERADVYCLAAVILRVLTGSDPVDSLKRRAKIELTGKDPIVRQLRLLTDIPRSKVDALRNALNVAAADRTENIATFAQEFLSRKKVNLRKVTIKQKSGRVSMAVAETLALLSLIFAISTVAVTLIGNPNDNLNAFESYSVPCGEVYVPNVVSESFSDVQKTFDKLGLNVVISYKKQSNAISSDTVISQVPDVCSTIPYGSTVELVLSAGSRKESVGDFTGFAIDSARAILEACGFKVNTRDESNSLYARGVVFHQSVSPGEMLEAGSEITLTVSSGNESIVTSQAIYIPNVVGAEYAKALETMRQGAMFLAISGYTYDSSVGDGVITYQYPSAGEDGRAGEIINVKVNKTQNKIVVPNVMYFSADDAKTVLEANGFEVDVKYAESTAVAAGAVIDQSIAGGESVEPGEKITLTLSSFYNAEAPDVEGLSYSEARESLRNAGFSCTVLGAVGKDADSAVVERQSIRPGTSAEAGTNIILKLKESE